MKFSLQILFLFYTKTEVYDQWTYFIAETSHTLNTNFGSPGQSFQLEPIGDDELTVIFIVKT